MEGTPKDTRPRAGEFAATGGLPVRRCAFAKTKFFLRKLVFALPANPQVDVACGSACCVARSPQGGGGMRRARGSAYPSGVALEDFSKTVGRFACRGFRPPSLATDWEWGGFKTHPTSEASDRPSVRHVCVFVAAVWLAFIIFNSRFDRWAVLGGPGPPVPVISGRFWGVRGGPGRN